MNEDYLPRLNDKISYDIDDERRISTEIEVIEKEYNNIKKKENRKLKDEQTLEEETLNQPKHFLSLNNVYCSLHRKNYIKFDSHNFIIICSKCIEEGKESNLKFQDEANEHIIKIEEKNIKLPEDTIVCVNHNNKKGSFYCDECKEFICKFCFAEEHKLHKCHLPEIIANEFKNYINDSIDNAKKLKPELDNTIDEISHISENLKVQKNEIVKVPSSSFSNITLKNKNEIDEFLNKFNNILDNLDNEVSSDYERHIKIKEKAQMYIKELNEISSKLKNENNSLNNFQLCIYHKNTKEKIKEILNFEKNSSNFVNIKLISLIDKCEKTKPNLLNDIILLNKSLSNYENTSMSSISTGQASNSILLRRFLRFIHNEIKFFKNTSLIVKTNSQIFLSGLAVCGLYISQKKIKDPNNNFKNDSIDIKVNIFSYDIDSGKKEENLFNEDFTIFSIIDKNDPSQIIYFSKGVKILAEQNYLITIENISSNSYCDLWVGNIGNNKIQGEQIIKCHNTNTAFIFKETEGIQTDFDEFNNGIIEGILYSKN